ncbi:hypothetical protein [Marinobacter sp.]|uniref:hypothetical protein n=1 Tax=Marinobacter sp. TaxID=50741 RepID=UPI002356F7A8|nr:hypothetical protein [Marinobacter sp.]
MTSKRPTEKELLEGLDERTSHSDELAEPLLQELTPLEHLRGSVRRYDRPTDPVWDEWFDSEGRAKEGFMTEPLGGRERFARLLEDSGGIWLLPEVSSFLKLTESEVRDRLNRNELLAFIIGPQSLGFPRFQFDDENRCVIVCVKPFLEETASWDPVSQIRFLLVPYQPESTGETPLDLLQRGETDRALELARLYLEQRP